MDDADSKKSKPLTPRERAKNVFDALAEDALKDATPLTNEERLEAERMREKLRKAIDDHMEGETAGTDWEKKAKKKKPPGSGYVI